MASDSNQAENILSQFRSSEEAFHSVALRSTSGPAESVEVAFRRDCDNLHTIGGTHPAVALAIENHLMICGSISNVPLVADDPILGTLDCVRKELDRRRSYIANTGSYVHGNSARQLGSKIERTINSDQKKDSYILSGDAAFVSLATHAEIMIVASKFEDDDKPIGAIICDLQDLPQVRFGEPIFPNAMLDSDTRSVQFDNVSIDSEWIMSGPSFTTLLIYTYVWHQGLLASVYLGAAFGALGECRQFAKTVRGTEGTLLSDLDGHLVDFGRLYSQYLCARAQVSDLAKELARITPSDGPECLQDLFDLAALTKYVSTQVAEKIVGQSRRFIGARGFTGGQLIERLTNEVIFGPLGPELNPVIERSLGKRILQSEKFIAQDWMKD